MDIICFANDWDGDPLSKKHIMRRLAQAGARVLWVSSLGNRAPRLGDAADRARAARKVARFAASALRGPRPVEPNLWVIDPIAAPVYASAIAARANAAVVGLHVRAAAGRLGFRAPIHYSFVPASAWVAGRLGEQLIVYHAADEYAAFGGADRAAVRALEGALLDRADLYIACSEPLYHKRRPSRRALLLRHGVEHAHFARALDPATPLPPGVSDLPRPIVGFIGLIAEWVDLHLLEQVADGLDTGGGGTLVLVGDVRGADAAAMARLCARRNVRHVGRRPYAELPGWCRGFDAAVLPFRVDELTVAANPLKLREYLAAGLPVISTDLPEASHLAEAVEGLSPGAVSVAPTAGDFVALTLARAWAADAGPSPTRSRAVAGEGWDEKVGVLRQALAAALGEKEQGDGRIAT